MVCSHLMSRSRCSVLPNGVRTVRSHSADAFGRVQALQRHHASQALAHHVLARTASVVAAGEVAGSVFGVATLNGVLRSSRGWILGRFGLRGVRLIMFVGFRRSCRAPAALLPRSCRAPAALLQARSRRTPTDSLAQSRSAKPDRKPYHAMDMSCSARDASRALFLHLCKYSRIPEKELPSPIDRASLRARARARAAAQPTRLRSLASPSGDVVARGGARAGS